MVREIEIPASEQSQTILVDELPNQFIEQSLYTESDSGIVVQGLRVRSVKDDRKSQGNEKNEKLKKELASAKHDLLVIEEDLETLENLITFSANRFERDLSDSKLDVKSVTELANFSMERRRKLAAELFKKQVEIEQTKKAISEDEFQKKRKPWVGSKH